MAMLSISPVLFGNFKYFWWRHQSSISWLLAMVLNIFISNSINILRVNLNMIISLRLLILKFVIFTTNWAKIAYFHNFPGLLRFHRNRSLQGCVMLSYHNFWYLILYLLFFRSLISICLSKALVKWNHILRWTRVNWSLRNLGTAYIFDMLVKNKIRLNYDVCHRLFLDVEVLLCYPKSSIVHFI